METEQTLLLQLRNAAMQERNELVRYNLKLAADLIDQALTRFTADPTTSRLATLQSEWSNGLRVLGYAGKTSYPGGNGSGLTEGALLAEAA